MACKTLRLDPGDGFLIKDYRIEEGHVEMRVLNLKHGPQRRRQWQRLTREQLITHVMENTVVAQWLQRRMGVRPLLRVCAPASDATEFAEPTSRSPAA
jgi:hypothetical protein